MSVKPTYEELKGMVDRLSAELDQIKSENIHLRRSVLAMVSHEVRTPMQAIMGFIQLITNTDLSNEEREEYMMLIEQAGKSLLSIVDTLADVSLIDSGELKLALSDCRLGDFVEQVYHRFGIEKRKMERNSVALLMSVDLPGKSYSVKTDILRLEQVLSHLLNNALMHTQKGIIEFGCSYIDHKQVRFFISDSGSRNMRSEMNLEYLQEPYSSLDLHNNARFRLGIAQDLVRLMGGSISVVENGYQGNTVSFTLPIHSTEHFESLISDISKEQVRQN